jgi:hypothetical protein
MLMQRFRERQASLIALDLGLHSGTSDAGTWLTCGSRSPRGSTIALPIGLARVWANAKARGGSVGRPAVRDAPELSNRIAALRASKHDASGHSPIP